LCLCVCSKLQYEVVVVDDNSPDGTLQVAERLREVYGKERITILSRPGKMGLGSAYIDGLKLCGGEFVFLMDADMSHHPNHIPEFIR
jgi:dolichol-phosphate mannosyltransferase